MSEVVDLRVSDPAVWAYVCQLQHEAAVGRILAVRCAACNTKLGEAANTAHGPGFAAWWRDYVPQPWAVIVDGHKLTDRETMQHTLKRAEYVEGDWGKEPCGYFAPLAIPPELPHEYVPLLVRCVRHGDAILNRGAVLAALRSTRRGMKVRMSGTRFEIIRQQIDGLKSEPKQALLVERFGRGESWTTEKENGDTPRGTD